MPSSLRVMKAVVTRRSTAQSVSQRDVFFQGLHLLTRSDEGYFACLFSPPIFAPSELRGGPQVPFKNHQYCTMHRLELSALAAPASTRWCRKIDFTNPASAQLSDALCVVARGATAVGARPDRVEGFDCQTTEDLGVGSRLAGSRWVSTMIFGRVAVRAQR